MTSIGPFPLGLTGSGNDYPKLMVGDVSAEPVIEVSYNKSAVPLISETLANGNVVTSTPQPAVFVCYTDNNLAWQFQVAFNSNPSSMASATLTVAGTADTPSTSALLPYTQINQFPTAYKSYVSGTTATLWVSFQSNGTIIVGAGSTPGTNSEFSFQLPDDVTPDYSSGYIQVVQNYGVVYSDSTTYTNPPTCTISLYSASASSNSTNPSESKILGVIPATTSASAKKWNIIIGGSLGILLLLIVIVGGFMLYQKKNKKEKSAKPAKY